ncbi:MAG: exodeoxyribonuclease VII large subunit [Polyangiales bacterium]
MAPSPSEDSERIFTVSELNRAVKLSLEHSWPAVWVQGELSNVHVSSAGHAYFTLNDETTSAQLRGAIFRADLMRSRVDLTDGARVDVLGKLSLFESRGQFQLVARRVRMSGEGDLAAKFELLRKKLEAEGLFDPERKRELPRVPAVVGVVTSAQGAAIQDVIRVASERCPVRIVIADCRVQGAEAPAQIVNAMERIQRLPDLDVVIVTRGGGSAEDLWAFNDEAVARAIANCRVPVVSGVGHEVDITIADLVADVRAATPSNAAEIVVPELSTLQQELDIVESALGRAMTRIVDKRRLIIERLASALIDPRRALAMDRQRWSTLSLSLEHQMRSLMNRAQHQLAQRATTLHALSPLAVLDRGYAIVTDAKTNQAVRSASTLQPKSKLNLRFSEGNAIAIVESIDP